MYLISIYRKRILNDMEYVLVFSIVVSIAAIIISVVSLLKTYDTIKDLNDLKKKYNALKSRHTRAVKRIDSLETMASTAKQDIDRNKKRVLDLIDNLTDKTLSQKGKEPLKMDSKNKGKAPLIEGPNP